MVQVRKVSLLCLLMVCVGQASAQLLCPTITIADLGNFNTTELSTEGLLARSLITAGETTSLVAVRIINYRILCDTAGLRRSTSSHISVLIEFQCSFLGGDGNLADCDGATNVIRQYQYRCSSSNEWENRRVVETLSPSATFQTEPTNQCRLCPDPTEFPGSEIDPDTHCLSCAPRCNVGLGRCYTSNLMEQCCSFYLEDMCVSECPPPLVSNNTTFDCECPSLTLNNGMVTFSSDNAIGSVATHTCLPGYDLVGDSTRTCNTNGWSGDDRRCNLIQCSNLPPIDKGEVMVRPDNRTLNALATYTCNTDYSLRGGDRVRICQSGSMWNGSEPKCESCKATDIDPDCIECGFDDAGNPICLKCKGDGEPTQDGKCPVEGTTDQRGGSCDTGCIVGIVLAILGAVIMAVVVALVVYAVYSYLTNPATKLAKAGTEGLNGVARDNPLYLPPDEIVGDVETA